MNPRHVAEAPGESDVTGFARRPREGLFNRGHREAVTAPLPDPVAAIIVGFMVARMMAIRLGRPA
jgi:hypothetical protein